jgi:hypothetical protein
MSPPYLTSFDLEIPTELPSQLLKCVLEDCKPNLCFRIIQAEDVDDTNEAYALRRLRKWSDSMTMSVHGVKAEVFVERPEVRYDRPNGY